MYLNRLPKTPREIAVWTALSYHKTFYTWGGDDPYGFDCSGLAIEALKAGGKIMRGMDYTAGGLYALFQPPGEGVEQMPGNLCFWKSSDGFIVHVEMVMAYGFSIGASGGGSKTKSHEDAIRDNAFIKIRPIERHRPFAGYRDPFIEAV